MRIRTANHSLIGAFAVALIFVLFVLICLAIMATGARAHEAPRGWKYPWACCANMDCQQISTGTDTGVIEPSADKPFYTIKRTGEVIQLGDKRIKESPDGEYHWCANQAGLDAGKTICLFLPEKGY